MEQEFLLDANATKKGLYLSQQQIDLLFIVSCNSKEQLESYFYKMCGQFPYQTIEEVIPNYESLDTEQAKRALFVKYQDILIGYKENYRMSSIEQAEYKLNMMRTPDGNHIPEDIKSKTISLISSQGIERGLAYLREEYVKKYGEKIGEDFIVKLNRLMKDDFENIKSVSYEDMEALHQRILNDGSIDTIIIATSKYENTVFSDGLQDYYDPYLTSKGAAYCRLTGKQMRFHALFDNAHLKELVESGKGKADKESILREMKFYIRLSLDYVREYNEQARMNGYEPIRVVEVFNELVEYNKEDELPYQMAWEKYFGITIDDIISCFDGIEKPEGVEFMYNETMLEEHPDRRRAVNEVLTEIMRKRPDLIDVFGNQMHLQHTHAEEYSDNPNDTIQSVRESLALMKDFESREFTLADGTTKKIRTEITEFDIHICKETYLKKIVPMLKSGELTTDDILLLKKTWIQAISEEIRKSGITPERITYWSIHDTVDHNLVRANIAILKANKGKSISELEESGMLVDTLYAGALGTVVEEKNQSFTTTPNQVEESKPVGEPQGEKTIEELAKNKPKSLELKRPTIPNSGYAAEFIILGIILATLITLIILTIGTLT